MSGSEEKTPTISPDQGATGETTTSSEKKEAGTQTGLSEEEKKAHFKKDYDDAVFELLGNIHMWNPETYRSGMLNSNTVNSKFHLI